MNYYDQTLSPNTISWEPMSQYSANFKTAKIVASDSDKIILKSTRTIQWGAIVMILFFISMLSFRFNFFTSEIMGSRSLILLIPLLVSAIAIIGIFRYFSLKVTFDKTCGCFVSERLFGGKEQIRFDAIHAVQLIPKYTSRSSSKGPCQRAVGGGYQSLELNLVMKDGSRKHLISSGEITSLQQDALKLSSFLKKPVWELD